MPPLLSRQEQVGSDLAVTRPIWVSASLLAEKREEEKPRSSMKKQHC